MEETIFDVSSYLKETAFDGDYSLFDDKNGGLFAQTPEETPREKEYSKDKFTSFKYDDMPDYDYYGDLEPIGHGLNDEGLSVTELEWLSKSEDEIRSRIFELAEEIQRETKEMYAYPKQGKSLHELTSSRKSEQCSPSRNDAYGDYQLNMNGGTTGSSNSESSPALASASTSSRHSAAQHVERGMAYLSLDSKPAVGYSRRDRFAPPQQRSRASSTGRNSDAGLVDWRVAARTAEQNAQRNESALGYTDEPSMDRCQVIGGTQQAIGAKRRLCRHFLKGFCNRGDSCDFLHDNSIFCPDEQKVFLGGLPTHMTAESLCTLLKEMNYTVINKPKILRGFTPQVCLSSIAEAQELIRKRKIYLDNTPVDVRPYEDRKPPDDLKRSVFLGGLAADTTVEHIQEDLARAGFPVENNPILKAGFVPQVVLESVEKAQELIKLAKVRINGKNADVRPYVNFRKRY